MPVQYDISPSLNLVVYICTGTVTAIDFFKTGDQVSADSRLQPKTNVIIDFYPAELEISVSDLKFAIEKMKETRKRGQEVRTAVLTKSASLKFLGDTVRLMSIESPFEFGIFNTEKDAIRWLGLPEEDALQFWTHTKKMYAENESPQPTQSINHD